MNITMVQFWLFTILLLSYRVNSSFGQCVLEGSPAGEVFEYAPADTIVLLLSYDGDTSDIMITLDSRLSPYFRLNGKTLLVSGATNITRDISFSGAQVSCSSGGSPTINSIFITIQNINSVNDVEFEESLYEETLSETQDVGSRIEVKANDEDVSSLSYNIDAQDPPGFFELIGSNSGILELIKPLDYKSNQQHTLTITATSSGFNNVGNILVQTDSTQVIVTVTDVDHLPPEFQPCDDSGNGATCVPPLYTASVSADQIGTVDVKPPILAVDGDNGINSPITYQFVDGTPTYLDYFTIDSSTAEVTMRSGIDVSIDRFVIAVEAREDSGKASIAYLVIDVVIVDDFKPEFQPGPRLSYISQSSYDNNIVAIVTEDEEGNVPLKLTVSDADDTQATFAYEVTSPYLVSSDGYVYFAPSAIGNYQTDDVEITAINLNAELNSPNRVSDSVTLTIETVANPTKPEPTTIEPTTPGMTTEESQQATITSCETSSQYGRQTLKSGSDVFCDGKWTVFQKRFNGSVDFNRDWNDYKNGFGSLSGEFWFGLENLHLFTNQRGCRVRFDLWSFDGDHAYAQYSDFSVEDDSDNYRLHIASYSGTAGDSMTGGHSLDSMQFSTRDRDNDVWGGQCGSTYGAWWHRTCSEVLLNNEWGNSQVAGIENILWHAWKGTSEALKETVMKVRCN